MASGRDWRLVLAGLWLLALVILVGCSQLQILAGKEQVQPEVSVGATFLRQGKVDQAVGQFDAAIKADPKEVRVYRQITLVCANNARYDLAAKYAEQGLNALPDAPVLDRITLCELAMEAYLRQGNAAKALTFGELSYHFAPDEPRAMNLLGYAIAEVYDVDMADPNVRAKLQKALELTTKAVAEGREQGMDDEHLGMIVDSVGWVHFKLHNYDEAIVNLSRATDLTPRSPEIHYHLGIALQKKQRYADAVTELRKAIQLSAHPYPAASDALQALQQLLPPSAQRPDPRPNAKSGPASASSPRPQSLSTGP